MKQLLFCLLFLVLQTRVQAYVGAVSSSTVETGRASVEVTDSPFMNPAALPFMKGYFFTSGIASAQDATNAKSQNLALSITDNLQETVVPTSLAYYSAKTNFASDDQVSQNFRLSLGNYVLPKLALGFGAVYKDDRQPDQRFSQINGTFGALYAPNPDLGFAFVAENILGERAIVPQELRLEPTVALAMTHIYKGFLRTRIDVVSGDNDDLNHPIWEAGLETYMNRWVIFRIGIQNRTLEDVTAYSAGIGFQGPKFGIHYAYFVSPQLESLTRHSVDLSVPIW
jgi:hypothetical protein